MQSTRGRQLITYDQLITNIIPYIKKKIISSKVIK